MDYEERRKGGCGFGSLGSFSALCIELMILI
jgi:hypothetical protein